MRGTHLTVGIVVLSLLAVGAVTGPAAAQVDSADETEICADAPANGDSLVVVLPGDRYVHADQAVTLLPGTEADIALCSGGELISTSAWPVSNDIDGVNVSSSDDFSYAITITNVEESGPVEFGPAIEQRGDVNTPSVTATPGRLVVTEIGGGTYRVAIDGDDRSRLDQANSNYESTIEEMQTAAVNLNQSAGEIAPDHGISDDDERVPNINQTQAVNDNYTQIQTVLFDADATGALRAYEQQHNATLAETSGHLENANQKIAAQAQATATGVLGNFLGVLVGGAVLGGIGGWFATNKILARVEVERRRSSAVDFQPKHLAGQAVVALVLVGIAVGLAFGLGLIEPLIVAVQAVIPL